MNNISSVGDRCCGCGICEGVCPINAIKMTNMKGHLRPVIDSQCIECGKCINYCSSEYEKEKISYKSFSYKYWGHSLDNSLRFEAASGGIVSEILKYLLRKGLVDYVVLAGNYNPSEKNAVGYRIVDVADDIDRTSGTNYCPVNLGAAIKDISNREGTCAIVGVPCFARGLRGLIKQNKNLDEKVKFVFSLLCNHIPSYNATDYLIKKYKVKNASLVKYRGAGWFGNLRFFDSDREIARISYTDYFRVGFYNNFWQKECLECWDHFGICADASFGDADFVKYRDTDKDNIGETMIFTNNEDINSILIDMEREKRIVLCSDQKEEEMQRIYGPISENRKCELDCTDNNVTRILLREKVTQSRIYCLVQRVINKLKRITVKER